MIAENQSEIALPPEQRKRRPDEENPWPGLDYYTEESAEYYFGRDEEIATLLSRIQSSSLTVLYGESGLGKSSLLQAGLFPRLRRSDWLPVYIRLHHSPGDGVENPRSLVEQTRKSIEEAIRRAVRMKYVTLEDGWTIDDTIPKPTESIWRFLHRSNHGLRNPQEKGDMPMALALVFDQFEEFFTLGRVESRQARRKQDEFLGDLADCVENRLPEEVLRKLHDAAQATESPTVGAQRQDGVGAGLGFTELDFTRSDYRIFLSLREDYLAHLHDLADLMPSIKENQMRLLPLTGLQALHAVYNPGRRYLDADRESPDPSRSLVDALVTREIVELVAASHRQWSDKCPDNTEDDGGEIDTQKVTVDPALLNMVCRELNNARQEKGHSQITTEIVDDLLRNKERSILRRFYLDSFKWLSEQRQAEKLQEFVEERLLTPPPECRRNILELGTAERDLQMQGFCDPQAAIRHLVNHRLVRVNKLPGAGVRVMELAHDVLCETVKQSRHDRILRKEGEVEVEQARKRLVEEEARARKADDEAAKARKDAVQALEKIELLERSRRRGRAVIWLAICLVAAIALAGVLGWKTFFLGNESRKESAVFFKEAKTLIEKDLRNGKTAALPHLAVSLKFDPNNLQAAKLLCQTLLENPWARPITVPTQVFWRSDQQIEPGPVGGLDGEPMVLFAASFSPDGKTAVAVGRDGYLHTWTGPTFEKYDRIDLLSGSELQAGFRVGGAAFSPGGNQFVFSPRSNNPTERTRVQLWEWKDGVYRLAQAGVAYDGPFRAVVWSADSRQILFFPSQLENTTASLFLREASQDATAKPVPNVLAADFTPDGKSMAVARPDGTVQILNVETLQQRVSENEHSAFQAGTTSPAGRIFSVIFDPAGKQFLTAGWNEQARLWSLSEHVPKTIPSVERETILRASFAGTSSAFAALCATGSNGTIILRDAATFTSDRYLPVRTFGSVPMVAFGGGGNLMLTLSGSSWSATNTLQVWDLRPLPPFDSQTKIEVNETAPAWLAKLANAVPGIPFNRYTANKHPNLSEIREEYGDHEKYPKKGAYRLVWDRFFSDP